MSQPSHHYDPMSQSLHLPQSFKRRITSREDDEPLAKRARIGNDDDNQAPISIHQLLSQTESPPFENPYHVGQLLQVADTEADTFRWLNAEVLELNPLGEEDWIIVHYEGFDSKFDCQIYVNPNHAKFQKHKIRPFLEEFAANQRDQLFARRYSKVVDDISTFLHHHKESLVMHKDHDKRIVADLHCIYAKALGHLGQHDLAWDATREAVRLCPKWHKGYSTMAMLLSERQDKHSEAVKAFKLALKQEMIMTEEERMRIEKRYEDLQLIMDPESSDESSGKDHDRNTSSIQHRESFDTAVPMYYTSNTEISNTNHAMNEEEQVNLEYNQCADNEGHDTHYATDVVVKKEVMEDSPESIKVESDDDDDNWEPEQSNNGHGLDQLPSSSECDEYDEVKYRITEYKGSSRSETDCESETESSDNDQSPRDHRRGKKANGTKKEDAESSSLSQRGVAGTTLDQRKNDISLMSNAQRTAYKKRDKNPNTYYYRFNNPGESQRGGKWDAAEHKKFMERARELGVNIEWGTFSKVIPGRVGYQCSNYWRELIKRKWVRDDNYVMEIDNKNKRKLILKFKKKKELEIIDKIVSESLNVEHEQDPSNTFAAGEYHPKAPIKRIRSKTITKKTPKTKKGGALKREQSTSNSSSNTNDNVEADDTKLQPAMDSNHALNFSSTSEESERENGNEYNSNTHDSQGDRAQSNSNSNTNLPPKEFGDKLQRQLKKVTFKIAERYSQRERRDKRSSSRRRKGKRLHRDRRVSTRCSGRHRRREEEDYSRRSTYDDNGRRTSSRRHKRHRSRSRHSKRSDVPSQYICPINWEVMKDPVILTTSGRSYERKAITEWIESEGTDPTSRRKATLDNLYPNLVLKSLIEDYMRDRK